MAITRATNLAGLGTVFDALTDGGGLSISGISTFTDLNTTNLTGTAVTFTTVTASSSSATVKTVEPGGADLRMVSGAEVAYFGTYSDSSLITLTNSSERIRILNDGTIGIGTTVSGAAKVKISGGGLAFDDGSLVQWGINDRASIRGYSGSGSNGYLAFSINTEHVRILSDGTIGINTIAPASAIDITGTAAEVRFYNDNRTKYSSLQYTGTVFKFKQPQGDHIIFSDYEDNELIRFKSNGFVGINRDDPQSLLHVGYDQNAIVTIANNGSAGSQSGIQWRYGSAENVGTQIVGVQTASSKSELRFITGNSDKIVTISAGGNVGAGITWPTHPFHAYQSMLIQYPGTPYLAFSEDSSNRAAPGFCIGYDGTNYSDTGNHLFISTGSFVPNSSGLNSKKMIITFEGDVGINTVCPIGSTLDGNLDIHDTNNAPTTILLNRSSPGAYGDTDIGNIIWYNTGSQTGGKGQIARIFAEAESSGVAGSMEFFTRASSSAVKALRLENIGTLTSQGTYTYTASGSTVIVTSGGAIRRTSSSIKYKRDVEDLDYSIVDNAITNLQPRWYRTKDAAGDDKLTWSHLGLIAEEVDLVEPRLVRYRTVGIGTTVKPAKFDEDGNELEPEKIKEVHYDLETPEPEDIDYARLAVINLAEIKVLRARIAELESRVGIASTSESVGIAST